MDSRLEVLFDDGKVLEYVDCAVDVTGTVDFSVVDSNVAANECIEPFINHRPSVRPSVRLSVRPFVHSLAPNSMLHSNTRKQTLIHKI